MLPRGARVDSLIGWVAQETKSRPFRENCNFWSWNSKVVVSTTLGTLLNIQYSQFSRIETLISDLGCYFTTRCKTFSVASRDFRAKPVKTKLIIHPLGSSRTERSFQYESGETTVPSPLVLVPFHHLLSGELQSSHGSFTVFHGVIWDSSNLRKYICLWNPPDLVYEAGRPARALAYRGGNANAKCERGKGLGTTVGTRIIASCSVRSILRCAFQRSSDVFHLEITKLLDQKAANLALRCSDGLGAT